MSRRAPPGAVLARAVPLLLATALCWPPGPALRPSAAAPPGHPAGAVVVVGVPGLRWDDVTATGTPTLWRLAGRGSVGSLSVRAGRRVTCPADGWVTVGAGNRARAVGGRHSGPGCPVGYPDVTATAAGSARVAVLPETYAENRRLSFGAYPGALAAAVRRGGGCVAAAGAGAALGAADRSGRVEAYLPGRPDAELLSRCPVTLVDLDLDAPPRSSAGSVARRAAVSRADEELAGVLAVRPAGALLLVVGVSGTGADGARLQLALADGPGFAAGRLTSASTRRPPFVQLVDVAPTVLAQLRLQRPSTMIGQPWQRAGGRAGSLAAEVGDLVDLDRAAVAQGPTAPTYFVLLVVTQLVVYIVAALLLRLLAAGRGRRTVLRLTGLAALSAAGAVVASYLANLAPWWRAGHPLPALLAAAALADAGIVAVALCGPWRRHRLGPAGAVAGLTALVLAVDLLTGARLQLSSVAGYSPLVAGRFAGIGNVAFGVLATGALLAAAALAAATLDAGRGRRSAVTVVVLVGAAAVVVDGAPTFGSDVGGVLALIPAFAVLAMLVAGARISARRLLLAGLAAVLVAAAFGLLDYARPPDAQTHLGRFVGQLLHGGAGPLIQRKATANLRLLTSSGLTLLVPVLVVAAAVALVHPVGGLRRAVERQPLWRAGLTATLVMAVVGLLVNDSGVAVPALALGVAVPLAVAVSLTASGAPSAAASSAPEPQRLIR